MSTEELLKPRFKVIANYPHSPYAIGELMNGNGEDFHITRTIYFDEGERHFMDNWDKIAVVQQFPALFQPLPWYADRQLEDMPEYVKYSDYYLHHYHLGSEFAEMVFKIVRAENGFYGIRLWDESGVFTHHNVECIYPATEADYLTYKAKKNG